MTIAVKTSACGTGSAYGGTSDCAPCGNHRRPATGKPAGGEDQQIRPVGQQADADDQLREAATQHQVDAGRVQNTRREREQELHLRTPPRG